MPLLGGVCFWFCSEAPRLTRWIGWQGLTYRMAGVDIDAGDRFVSSVLMTGVAA
jgi:hypothetical protein